MTQPEFQEFFDKFKAAIEPSMTQCERCAANARVMARLMLDANGPIPKDLTVTEEAYNAELAVIAAGWPEGTYLKRKCAPAACQQ